MNKTPNFLMSNLTPLFPGESVRNPQEANNLFDVRFSQKNKNLGYKQDMSRRSSVRQSIAQVKISLGHRPRSHYKTMLANPSNKLQPFVFPGMSVDQLKSLAKVLLTSDPRQRSQLKKDASDRQRRHALEQEQKRKEALAVKRQEAVARRNQIAQENTFLRGLAEEVKYNFTDENDFQKMLDRYLPRLQTGERFLIKVGGWLETWFTLSLAKYEEITEIITTIREAPAAEESDMELMSVIVNSDVTVQRPGLRLGRDYEFANGEFLPYTHDYEDPDLINELANLGCWTEVNEKNYVNNCLWLAFKSAGVSPAVLEAMKFDFIQRKISRKNVKKIAEQHNLHVIIHTDGDKNVIKYGNESGLRVELAIIKGPIDHYIHYKPTKFNSYAIANYDSIKDKKKWWTFKSADRKDTARGMNSLDLLRAVLAGDHVKPIDISTEGIFRTQFHDRINVTEFNTLEYPEEYSGLFHEPRMIEGQVEQEGEIEKVRNRLDPLTLTILDAKFVAQGFGPEEQLKHLKRAKRNGVKANVFFDFEASPFDRHVEYCGRYSEFDEARVHEVMTGHQFLQELCAKYGKVDDGNKKFNPPTIKLLAHNLTYDYAFIAPFLSRVFLVEKPGAKIVCGTAHFSTVHNTPTNSPNAQVIEWLKNWENRIDLGLNDEKINSACCVLKKMTEFVGSPEAVDLCKGIGKPVKEAMKKNIPWGDFKPEPVMLREYKAIQFVFQDTIKMIDMSLAKFGKSFGLDQGKEIFPHSLMTKKFIKAGGIATLAQLHEVCKNEKLECGELLRKLQEADCVIHPREIIPGIAVKPQYDMIKYSSHYCKIDVQVLKDGWRKFRDLILDKYQLDTFHYPTLASLSDQYFIDQGCFDGVHQMAGVPRTFIANCTIGGRVMCANNNRSHTKKKLADFDGVSLYPSAMKRLGELGGYLKGAPKVWSPEVDLSKVDGYFLKIKVTSLGKRYRFPITRIKDDKGGCNWTNDLVDKDIFVDRFTLEDLVKHSQITYTISQGYYFNEGRNPKIEETISTLFSERLRIKKADPNNPMQLIIKLMMNASYGKTGLKPIDCDVKYVSPNKKTNFIQNHFNHIKCGTDMPNGQSRIELYKEIDTHFNRQHCACEILSMSKVIMNEVVCLAEDIGADIEYTDTDSMHIDFDKVDALACAFREKYGRELEGDQLGQFHVDFEDLAKDGGEVSAKESYFLGKKTYIDELTDEKGNKGYHIRMKGIPGKCINAKVKAEYNDDPLLLYKDLYEGKPVKFDLKSGGNCCFKTGKDHFITTVESMTRTVCFPLVDETRTNKRKHEEDEMFEETEEVEECSEEEEE